MPNQYKNKIIYGDQTLMDITDTTASSEDVLEGEVFYSANGARSVGTLGDATQQTHGLMSAADKTNLDNIVAAGNPNATEIQMSSSDTTTVATAITNINDKIGTVPSGQTVEGQITALNDKADKVANAISGNFAGLDANGNLTDSGSKASDFLTSTSVIDIIYPIGSIYMSVAATNPGVLFTGTTWTQLKDRFLLGAGDTYTAGDTGGSASVSYTPAGTCSGGVVGSHKLTTNEIPSHNHTFEGTAVDSGDQSQSHTHSGTTENQDTNHTHTGTSENESQGHKHTGPSHTHTGPSHSHTGPSHHHLAGRNKTASTGSSWGVPASYPEAAGGLATSDAGTGATGAAGTGATGAAGTGDTGGNSVHHTHKTTTGNQSASHKHKFTSGNANRGHTHSVTAAGNIKSTGGGEGHDHTFTQPIFTGTAATINTIPPYLVVYMWQRTA